MNEEINTVMTVYLRNGVIEKFSINHLKKEDAEFYCDTINSLKVDDELKVCAKIIKDNTHYSVIDIIPLSFDIIVSLGGREVQKIMREVDSQVLAIALKGANKETQDKIFKNMSVRAAAMLKEDMEYYGPVRKSEIKAAQDKILNILKKLDELGEIILERSEVVI